MRCEEIAWFANHKYGEQVYYLRTKDEIRIFTPKSKWRILLRDFQRFGHYTLAHWNHKSDRAYYHVQSTGTNLEFLVFYAIMHDLDVGAYGKEEWHNFQHLYEMYKLGRQLEESCATWAFLAGEDWALRTSI